jgi:predicted transcriptional regulator YheO
MYFLCHYKNLAIIQMKTNVISIRNENDEIKKLICLNEELSKFLYRHDFLVSPSPSRRAGWKKKSYIKTRLKYYSICYQRNKILFK